MREIICFAWGTSSLGDFVVATSDKGIVTLEFSSLHAAMEDTLQLRFPHASLERREDDLAGIIGTVVGLFDNPAADCCLPLDLRGTSYEVNVWRMLREIPSRHTTTYGALAAKLGSRDAREVTAAIANNSIAVIVPCHRVIKKDGSISGYRWGGKRKRALLAREQRMTEH